METTDLLKRGDKVTVIIYGPDDEKLYTLTGDDFHTLDSAVKESIEKADLTTNPENCVFEVRNDTRDVSHRYRINAHGHLKLIV